MGNKKEKSIAKNGLERKVEEAFTRCIITVIARAASGIPNPNDDYREIIEKCESKVIEIMRSRK